MENTELSYEQKIGEVETIINDLQRGELSVDELIPKIKEASGYLKSCHEKIVRVEKEVATVIEDVEKIGVRI